MIPVVYHDTRGSEASGLLTGSGVTSTSNGHGHVDIMHVHCTITMILGGEGGGPSELT